VIAASTGTASADAVAAVVDSLVALILGVLSFLSASRTVRHAPARRHRRAGRPEPEPALAGPPGPDPAEVPPLSWPGIYLQVTSLYERLLGYCEQETTRLRARVAELEEGPRMPIRRGHERREERRERRRVRAGDTYTDGDDVELEAPDPGPDAPEAEQVGGLDHEGGPDDDGSH
jgi:hypothetical protein